MDKLEIKKSAKANNSVTRTIRISGANFDRINDLAEKNDISFNCVVNQIIDFGLNNVLEE